MSRGVMAVLAFLSTALLVLLRGLWYPGLTGEQKAEILLNDVYFPSRALLGINMLAESTLNALAEQSGEFKNLSPSGRTMVTRIAVCEKGEVFESFASYLSSSLDENVQRLGRIAITHRGSKRPFLVERNPSQTFVSTVLAASDYEQLNYATFALAYPPQSADILGQQRIVTFIKAGKLRPELVAAILLSGDLLSDDVKRSLALSLMTNVNSPYLISAFWTLHFLNPENAAATASVALSMPFAQESGNAALLKAEVQRAGGRVKYPTAYSEYLCS